MITAEHKLQLIMGDIRIVIDGVCFYAYRETYSEGYAKWVDGVPIFDSVKKPGAKTRISAFFSISQTPGFGWTFGWTSVVDGHLSFESYGESLKVFKNLLPNQQDILKEHLLWLDSPDCHNLTQRIRNQKAFL